MVQTHQTKRKKSVLIAWSVFILALAATMLAEFFIKKKVVFGLEGKMFFNAWYGFGVCVVIILFSKILGLFIKRQEGYYKEKR